MQLERGRRGWVIAAAALSGPLGLATARTAHASCQAEPYGLLWSYPANGAQQVPIDADLFVNGQLNGLPSLDGEPLPRLAAGVYDLGVLQPETRYEVRWEEAVLGFTTGSATEYPPRAPSPDVRVTRNPIDFARCPLLPPQGCFDTGQHTGVRFEAGPARAWLVDVVSCGGSVRQMVWPFSCGAPVVESEDRIICASMRSTQGAGFSESTGVICSIPDVPLDTLPRSSGCVGAWPPEGALTLAADDGVTVGSQSGLVEPSNEARQDQPSSNQPSSDEGTAPSAPAAGCALAAAPSAPAGPAFMAAGVGLVALTLLRRRAGGGSGLDAAHRSRSSNARSTRDPHQRASPR
jgi:hypothetical protein